MLKWKHVETKPLAVLRKYPDRLELYERGVQVPYKWATFYLNMATAVSLVLASRLHIGPDRLSIANVAILLAVGALVRAAFVQWKIYVNYFNTVFSQEEVESSDAKEC